MVRALLLALLLATVPAVATAQPPGTPQPITALAWITGSWRGSGTMFGNPSEASLVIAPVLAGRFLELSYRAGPFEGRAFYSPGAAGAWQARWFDSRGMTFPIAARADGRTLTSDWGSAETERGRTVYRLADDGRLTSSILSASGRLHIVTSPAMPTRAQ